MTLLIASIFIGMGATLIFDLWGVALSKTGIAAGPAWQLPGRWFGLMPQGRFVHDDIAAAPPVPNETAIGWVVHYLVGIVYAFVLVAWGGRDWLAAPTLAPALFIGVVTVLAGWLLMNPGMGRGVAASRTDNPAKARILSLIAHVVFGIGLWLSALAFSATL
jgi:hypothetical protein